MTTPCVRRARPRPRARRTPFLTPCAVNIDVDCPVFDGLFKFCQISTGGSVGGDIYAAGESAWIEGSVGGRIVGAGRRIDVLGSVGEDLFLAAERIEIHEGASIGGDVLYDSPGDPVVRNAGWCFRWTRMDEIFALYFPVSKASKPSRRPSRSTPEASSTTSG